MQTIKEALVECWSFLEGVYLYLGNADRTIGSNLDIFKIGTEGLHTKKNDTVIVRERSGII